MDVMRGEAVESELDRLIEKRHDRRVTDEGESPAERDVPPAGFFARLLWQLRGKP